MRTQAGPTLLSGVGLDPPRDSKAEPVLMGWEGHDLLEEGREGRSHTASSGQAVVFQNKVFFVLLHFEALRH